MPKIMFKNSYKLISSCKDERAKHDLTNLKRSFDLVSVILSALPRLQEEASVVFDQIFARTQCSPTQQITQQIVGKPARA